GAGAGFGRVASRALGGRCVGVRRELAGGAGAFARGDRGVALCIQGEDRLRLDSRCGRLRGMAVARVLGLDASKAGAGGRNRTDETTLEEWSFTTKLHPRG